jgi:oxalate decarboxylase/phosphoglucose isomerase-like protein (cupin superfamily)
VSDDERLGKNIILENDRVRVWDDSVQWGETGSLHMHRRPYLAIVIAGERAETVGADGNVLRTFELEPGAVFYFGEEDLPITHALRNTGTKDIMLRAIELL